MMKDKLSKDVEEVARVNEHGGENGNAEENENLGVSKNAGVSHLVLLFESYFHSMKSKMQHSLLSQRTLRCTKLFIGHTDQ